jgi:VanZ family protein
LFKFAARYKVWLIYLPFILYWLILAASTSFPGVTEKEVLNHQDKIAHFGGYFILASLMYLTFSAQRKYPRLYAMPGRFTFFVSGIYGIVDELHQLFIPRRSCDIADYAADLAGTVIAIALLNYLSKKTSILDPLKIKSTEVRKPDRTDSG